MVKTLKNLTAQEVLAFAIQSEEEDGRIYADLAERIRKVYPGWVQSLEAMHDEEDGHRHRLISLYRERFGEHMPLIRRQGRERVLYPQTTLAGGQFAGSNDPS